MIFWQYLFLVLLRLLLNKSLPVTGLISRSSWIRSYALQRHTARICTYVTFDWWRGGGVRVSWDPGQRFLCGEMGHAIIVHSVKCPAHSTLPPISLPLRPFIGGAALREYFWSRGYYSLGKRRCGAAWKNSYVRADRITPEKSPIMSQWSPKQ